MHNIDNAIRMSVSINDYDRKAGTVNVILIMIGRQELLMTK